MSNKKYIYGTPYSVDTLGRVYSYENCLLQTTFINKEAFVIVDLGNGVKTYNVGTLVLLAYGKLPLDLNLVDTIQPLYRDLDCENLSPSNLIYCFTQHPLPVKHMPGFYHIPFYTKYGVNESGLIVNIVTDKIISQQVCKNNGLKKITGGYTYSRIKSDVGNYSNVLTHRAVAYAFHKYTSNVLELDCNHMDGKPWNNHFKNLEWCTRRENNLHAVMLGLKNQAVPVLTKNLQTGKVVRYPSIMFCARALGYNRVGDVLRRIGYGNTKVNKDLIVVKYDDGTNWLDYDLQKMKIVKTETSVIARNVFTGELNIFDSAIKCGQGLGLSNASISKQLKNKSVLPLHGWNFKYVDDLLDWPKHTARHLRIYEKYPSDPPNGVIVMDVVDGVEYFELSAKDVQSKYDIPKEQLYRCISNKSLFKNRYRFSLFNLKLNLGLPIE